MIRPATTASAVGAELAPDWTEHRRRRKAGHGTLWEDQAGAPDPIDLANGQAVMVGSLAAKDTCGARLPLRCEDCGDYVLMAEGADCQSPKCHRCKPEYVPRRAAAASLRFAYYEDRAFAMARIARLGQAQPELLALDPDELHLEWMQIEDEDPKLHRDQLAQVGLWDRETNRPNGRLLDALHGKDTPAGGPFWIRHLVLSPSERLYPDTRHEAADLLNQAWDLAEKKGAIGGIGFIHPWRGDWATAWRGPEWHVHFVAIVRSPRMVPGGRRCCVHQGVGREGSTAPCCTGDPDECQGKDCANRKRHEAQKAVWHLRGKLSYHRSRQDPDPSWPKAHYKAALQKAERDLVRARQRDCDEDWFFAAADIKQDQNVPLKAGKHEAREVNRGILGLIQYDLEHAGVLLNEEGKVRHHTVRWFGCLSYRNLQMDPETRDLEEQLKNGEDSFQECPDCGGHDLKPVSKKNEVEWTAAWATIYKRNPALQPDPGDPPDREPPPDHTLARWDREQQVLDTARNAYEDLGREGTSGDIDPDPHPFDGWEPGRFGY